MKQLQRCGIITRTMGLKGEFLIETDNFNALFANNDILYLGFSPQFTEPYTVVNSKFHGKHIQVLCKNITVKEKAELLIGKAVFIDADKKSGKYKEEFMVQEIIGCSAIDHITKNTIGTINDVWQLPANDVWVITTPDNKEILLPVIDSTVIAVHTEKKYIEIALMEEIDGDE